MRRIHGMIAEVDDLMSNRADFRTYRLRMVPRVHRLTLIEMQDIFMNLTVPELILEKLKLVNLDKDVEFRLNETYPRREFIAQYGESDFAFTCRLAEHLGISFYFDHADGRDKLVFTDQPWGFQRLENAETIYFRGRGEEREVYELEAQRRLIPNYYVVRDYNYRMPQLDLTSEYELPSGYAGGVIEDGNHFKTPAEGKLLAKVRAEEREATQLVYLGKSDICKLGAGMRCTLDDHPDSAALDLLIVEVEHEVRLVVAGGGRQADEKTYVNTFRATPGARTYRPPRITPKPRIAGLVTGIIDGGELGAGDGKYARLDDQGRYTVRFLFDATAGTGRGRPASRPVRMAQNYVGARRLPGSRCVG